jgi:dimethylargininase
MSPLFSHAIVRIPAENFAQGLTTAQLGRPVYDQVLHQHARYCDALRACGLALTTLEVDPDHPDSTFVEDTAVLTAHSAILTRPGARSREGEVAAIRQAVSHFFPATVEIEAPGTVDGGDICEAENHFFLGLSQRTNEAGLRQLAAHLARDGYTSSVIDVRGINSILHLKSGVSYIGDNTLVVMEELAPLFPGFESGRRGRELRRQLHSRERKGVGGGWVSAADGGAQRSWISSAGAGDVRVSKDGWRPQLSVPAVLKWGLSELQIPRATLGLRSG